MDIANLSPSYRIALFAGYLAVFFVCERLWPLRQQHQALTGRLLTNITLSALSSLVAAFLVRPAALAALGWGEQQHLGLLQWLSLPTFLEALTGFLLLDLSFYYWHLLNHRWSFFGGFIMFIISIPIWMLPRDFDFILSKLAIQVYFAWPKLF